MRTTLFLPTLLALGLASGAALADKSHGAVDHLRHRGDVLDKSYRAAPSHASPQGSQHVNAPVRPTRDPGASRVTCSEMGQDCPQRSARTGGGSERGGASSVSHAPTFLDKVLGSDRTAINEAGETQQMSSRAVKRAWSHGGAGGAGAATVPLAHQQQHLRTGEQASANRMACNDAGACMMSSKGAKKEWAYNALKAGTWKGPEAAPAPAAAPAAAPAKSEYVKVTARRGERAAKTEAPSHDGEHE
jgi:hypothetical protein